MSNWALLFLCLAVIAGVFGFGGQATASTDVAKILFALFSAIFLVAVVARITDDDDA